MSENNQGNPDPLFTEEEINGKKISMSEHVKAAVQVNDKRHSADEPLISVEEMEEIRQRDIKAAEERSKQSGIVALARLLSTAASGLADLGNGKEVIIGTVIAPGQINPLVECLSDTVKQQIKMMIEKDLQDGYNMYLEDLNNMASVEVDNDTN